jgi:tetratricopeptide (TPR) repeat protein
MGSGRDNRLSGKRKRCALALVLLLVAVVVVAVAGPRLWVRGSQHAPRHLELIYAAWNEFNAKRYDQASVLLDRRAAEVAPTSLEWMLRARIAESQNRPAEALSHLKHIPDSDSISAQAWLKAGQIELAQHRTRAAEAAYRHALAINPDQIQSHRELAFIYGLQRRKAECDAQFRALARLMPLDYVLAFAWCQNDCEIWDPNEAIRILSPIVANDPGDRWSRLALATNYRLTNQVDEAEATLRPLPNSDPDARVIRVQIAMDRGDFDAAEKLALEGPADHARLNSLRGRLALQAGDSRQAVAHFRAALRQDPRDRDVIQGLGAVLQRLGDPEAKEFLQVAARHDRLKRTIVESVVTIETDPKLFYKLGEICESVDRTDVARVWYQLAIGRDPLDNQAQQALARLDQTARAPDAAPIRKADEENRAH